MAKNNNTVLWIIGIVVFLLVVTRTPLLAQETDSIQVHYYDKYGNEISQPQVSKNNLLFTEKDTSLKSVLDLSSIKDFFSDLISSILPTYVAEASTGSITILANDIHHARWVEAKQSGSSYVWGSDWASSDDNELDNIGINVVSSGVESRRGYISWYLDALNSLPSGADITNVKLNYYVHDIKDTYSSSSCNDLEFFKLKDSYISDWTPDTSLEAAKIWYEIEDHTRYYKDTSVKEDAWDSASLGSSAASRIQSD